MSRATLIDERPEVEEESTTKELTTDSIENPVQEEESQETESNVPEKYQGKSVEQLVQMHQELEKFSGKQSTEVGELRNVVDSYIQNQTELSQQEAPLKQQDKTEDVDFFVNPQDAVNQVTHDTHNTQMAHWLDFWASWRAANAAVICCMIYFVGQLLHDLQASCPSSNLGPLV